MTQKSAPATTHEHDFEMSIISYNEPKPFMLKNKIENEDEDVRRSMLDTSLYSNDNLELLSDAFFGSNAGSPVRKCSEKVIKTN